jgi:type IV pilus assembly protein PilB
VTYEPSIEDLRFYTDLGGPPKYQFWHGAGCNFCFRTGYENRVGVYELLRITDEMKRLIMERAPHDELRLLAMKQGMRTLQQSGVQLVANDVTTISEVIRSIYAG